MAIKKAELVAENKSLRLQVEILEALFVDASLDTATVQALGEALEAGM
jgi:hypothetical protein